MTACSSPQGVNDADDVGRQVQDMIRLDRFRCVCLPIPALIRRDGTVAGIGKRCHLVPPRVPGFRPAMAKEDERALALLGQMHAYSVRIDKAVLDRVQGDLRMQTTSGARRRTVQAAALAETASIRRMMSGSRSRFWGFRSWPTSIIAR
jgi:hypothetical protein